jgi:hypothetical protein
MRFGVWLLSAAALVMSAQGAFDTSGYSYSAGLVVSGYTGTETLTNFPVVIKLGTNLPGFRYTQFKSAQAADLRFVDAATNELNSEIELWDTNGSSFVWVQAPRLNQYTNLTMYWGKAGLSAPAYRTSGAVFNDGIFTGVWHMQTNYVTDSTGHGYKASSIPVPSGITTTNGVIGRAQRFNGSAGSDNRILISQAIKLTNQTLSAWIWLADLSREGVVMAKDSQMFFWQQADQLRFETPPWGGDTKYSVASAGAVSNWVHFAAVQSGLQATMYINGAAVGSWTKSSAPAPGTEWFEIGGGWSRLFNGRIDECRAESAARSAAWIAACYQNQANPDAFVDYSPTANVLKANGAGAAGLHLSWPARGDTLQTTPSLAEANTWTTNGLPAPTFDGESNHVIVPISGDAAFFRLSAPHKDFAFQVSGGSLMVTQGLASTLSVAVAGVNGFSNVVTIGFSNVPSGLSAYLFPSLLSSGSTILTLEAAPAATPGTYAMTLTGRSGLVTHTADILVTVVEDSAAAAYTWPSYVPNLDYNFTNEYSKLSPPSNVLNDVTGVAGTATLASNWFCFRYGSNMNALVSSNAWVPMLQRLNTDFAYFRDVMGWPPDKRAKRGYYSTVYLYGSGLSTDSASNTATGGWQGTTSYGGEYWPMGLISYYPVYCFDLACAYSDKDYQTGAVVHEMIHSVLSDMPGCKQACWFQEGGNTWLQGTAAALQSGSTNFTSMGWLSAGQMLAPFMPIECYTGWLQDDSFGGPCAEGVNMYSNSTQICTWRNLLGGTQYGEGFPHFMGEMIAPGSVAWIWRYCTNRVLEGMATAPNGLGEYQTRRLIREFRARSAFCDFGRWSAAYKALLNNNWGASIGPEWSPYWTNCATWLARCYVVTTNSGGTLTPERRTLPGWSGANQIPLTASSSTATVAVNFTPLGTNLTCQLVYRATDSSVVYSKPVSSGICTLTPPSGKAIKNNVVIAVICNSDYAYQGEYSRTNKYDYRLTITGSGASGIAGAASIASKWYQ